MATVIADALGEHTFEFVAELLCDKEGVKVLVETLQVHDRLQDTYWICAFSVNQHAGICGANPDGDTDPVTKIPHPVCGCKTPKFFNKGPPLNEQGESIMCEMNKFDDMMALLAKKNPSFAEVVAVDADLNLFHILVVAMLRWMGPWQRFHKGTLKGWARAMKLPFGGIVHLQVAPAICSGLPSLDFAVILNVLSFSWKMYSDARLAASDWHFQFAQLKKIAEWCLANSFWPNSCWLDFRLCFGQACSTFLD